MEPADLESDAPVLVVVGYVSGQYLIEMSTTEDEHPIQVYFEFRRGLPV
jgi:hypothetical protein